MSFKQTPDLVTADPQGGKKAAAKDLLVSVGVDPGDDGTGDARRPNGGSGLL